MVIYEPAMLHGPIQIAESELHLPYFVKCNRSTSKLTYIPIVRVVYPKVRDKAFDATWNYILMLSYDLAKLTFLAGAIDAAFKVKLR